MDNNENLNYSKYIYIEENEKDKFIKKEFNEENYIKTLSENENLIIFSGFTVDKITAEIEFKLNSNIIQYGFPITEKLKPLKIGEKVLTKEQINKNKHIGEQDDE
jgi:hypothetical protein